MEKGLYLILDLASILELDTTSQEVRSARIDWSRFKAIGLKLVFYERK